MCGRSCTFCLMIYDGPSWVLSLASIWGDFHSQHRALPRVALPVIKLRSIVHVGKGAHSLPIGQGRVGGPRSQDCCADAHFVPTNAMTDKHHRFFDCPRFENDQGLRQQHAETFQDFHEVFMRQKTNIFCQYIVCQYIVCLCSCVGQCQGGPDVMTDASSWYGPSESLAPPPSIQEHKQTSGPCAT